MEENFVGYLLKALDAETSRQVEGYLREHPEAGRRLDLLRQALEPLEADPAEIDPPPGLAVRTLARVAEYCCRDMPHAPAVPRRRAESPAPRWWRRADVLVAASILLCVSLLIPPVVSYLRRQHDLLACQNNLRQFGVQLIGYSQEHRGEFPNVADRQWAPRNVAGIFLPVLMRERGLDPALLSVRCPGNGPPEGCHWTLKELRDMPDEQFRALAPRLACCYAYTLGYRDGQGHIRGLRQGDAAVPLMADRPPSGPGALCAGAGNSPNHGGGGQNVLYTDGHMAFQISRVIDGDDIYLNRNQQVGAGADAADSVLGPSEAQP